MSAPRQASGSGPLPATTAPAVRPVGGRHRSVLIPRNAAVHHLRPDVEPQACESAPNARTARFLSPAGAAPLGLRPLRDFLPLAEGGRFSAAPRPVDNSPPPPRAARAAGACDPPGGRPR